MARFSHVTGIDIWEDFRGAALKPFGSQDLALRSSAEGAASLLSLNHLSFQVKPTLGYSCRFMELAQEVNDADQRPPRLRQGVV